MSADQFDLFSAGETTSPSAQVQREALEALLTANTSIVLPSHAPKPSSPDQLGEKKVWLPPAGKGKRRIMIVGPCPKESDREQASAFSNPNIFRLLFVLDKHVSINLLEDCYVTNLVKYALPSFDPLPQEAVNFCWPIFEAEVAKVQPDIILCLGSATFKHLAVDCSEIDEFYGNSYYSEKLKCRVALVYHPSTVLAAPEEESNWILDLRSVLNRHNPRAKTNWEEQDGLPTHRPTSLSQLREVVDNWVGRGLDQFAIDTEFVPNNDWLDALMFKVTIASAVGNIDLHLYEPAQGYKPVFVPATLGANKGVPEQYYTKSVTRMYFESRSQFNAYLADFPHRRQAIHAFIGEYRWVFGGTEADVAAELCRLLCRPGNRIWGHNGRSDYRLLLKMGVNLAPYIWLDTITLAQCLQESQRFALEPLARKYLGAPSHKLDLTIWLSDNVVKGGKLPYIFIPRTIIDPYAVSDVRRTFDLVDPLLADLELQSLEAEAAGEPTLRDAYFKAKMPEFFCLMDMEIIGQPVNLQTFSECLEWYERRRKALISEVIEDVKALTGWEQFYPDSTDEVRKLLFEFLGLQPLHTTDQPPIPWDELEPQERAAKTPAVDQETLKILSAEHPLCRKLNTCRILGTIEKNYLRRGARWYLRKDAEVEEGFSLEFCADGGDTRKPKKRKNLDRYLDAEGLTTEEYWEEVRKDAKSRSLSQVMNCNGWLYTSYSELLETHRLASYPNVSAISKGEEQEMKKLLGEQPPHSIRNIFEPHHVPVNTGQFLETLREAKKQGLDIVTFRRSAFDRQWFYIESDWSTGEVWYLVTIAQDAKGIEIMGNPERCIHASVARNMCPYIPKDMPDLVIKKKYKAERDAAKPFVFGIPYGRGSAALVRQLNMEAVARGEEAKYVESDGDAYIQAYQETLPGSWEYLLEQKDRVESPGYLVSPWGFKRRFPRNLTNKTQLAAFKREASNWQIQHGIACVKMEAAKAFLRAKNARPHMPFFLCDILHDATKYIVHGSVVDEALAIVEEVMDTGLVLPFPVQARLRHSVETQVRWCGEGIEPEQMRRQAIAWEEVCRLVPTATFAHQLETTLRSTQVHPTQAALAAA